ncbi:MAG TPA: hypothetical protein VLC50_04900, partial [Actinomycetes bacterium]|nr:hypothetical protein [Actinomycetes bacterium]
DSLDVVGVHLVGGMVGTLLVGLLASGAITGGPAGLLYGGQWSQLARQAVAALVVAGYSFALAWVIGSVIDRTIGLRVDEADERVGIDLAVHAESAYALAPVPGTALAQRGPVARLP